MLLLGMYFHDLRIISPKFKLSLIKHEKNLQVSKTMPNFAPLSQK